MLFPNRFISFEFSHINTVYLIYLITPLNDKFKQKIKIFVFIIIY